MITDVFLDQKRVNVCEHTVSVFTMCSLYIYSLLIENDIIETFQLSFRVFCVPFIRRSLNFFSKSLLSLYLLL
jgi:hypothetical protein